MVHSLSPTYVPSGAFVHLLMIGTPSFVIACGSDVAEVTEAGRPMDTTVPSSDHSFGIGVEPVSVRQRSQSFFMCPIITASTEPFGKWTMLCVKRMSSFS